MNRIGHTAGLPVMRTLCSEDRATNSIMTYDAFISHASEDKHSIVKELVDLLVKNGLKIWYDDFSLCVGDSLSKSIDRGLQASRFGIVVISKNFLEKSWPEYEYRSLLSKEMGGQKVILPIWHGVTKAEVQFYSPFLSDKVALDTSVQDLPSIVLHLLEVIRPDEYDSLQNYHSYLRNKYKDYKFSERDILELKAGGQDDVPHVSWSIQNRLFIIHWVIGKYICSYSEFVRGMTSGHSAAEVEAELISWEAKACSLLEYVRKFEGVDEEKKLKLCAELVAFSLGANQYTTDLTVKEKVDLFNIWQRFAVETYSPKKKEP